MYNSTYTHSGYSSSGTRAHQQFVVAHAYHIWSNRKIMSIISLGEPRLSANCRFMIGDRKATACEGRYQYATIHMSRHPKMPLTGECPQKVPREQEDNPRDMNGKVDNNRTSLWSTTFLV